MRANWSRHVGPAAGQAAEPGGAERPDGGGGAAKCFIEGIEEGVVVAPSDRGAVPEEASSDPVTSPRGIDDAVHRGGGPVDDSVSGHKGGSEGPGLDHQGAKPSPSAEA